MRIKQIFAFLLSLIMVMGIISAAPTPLPINGKLIGDSISNLPVEVTNLRTSVSVTVYTTLEGEYLVDASEFKGVSPNLMGGDVFRSTITSCSSDSRCTKEITYVGQDELLLIFDLTEVDLPDTDPEPDPEPEPEPETENKVTTEEGQLIATTNAFYGQPISIKLDDGKISYLIDGTIDFNGETIDVKEEVYFEGVVKTSIDDVDFGKDSHLTVEEYALEYKYIFDDQVILLDISIKHPLKIKVLGRNVTIISATSSEITARFGTEVTILQGETKTVDGNKIEVIAMTDSVVSLKVNGGSGSVTIGNSKKINGLEVVVDNILYQAYDNGIKEVTLIVGDKVQETYQDGDFMDMFVEDSEEWEWEIQMGGAQQFIGVWNVEAYQTIDEDDDYHALGIGDSLFLPNDYLEIKYSKVIESESTDINIRVKDGYLYAKGDTDSNSFSFGTDEFDRVYVNDEGIYDEDLVLITTDKVQIGESSLYLEKGSIKIGDLTIELGLVDILFKGISFALKDETFMDYLGMIFEDPEDAVEEKRGFEVSVPDERPESVISFGKDIPDEAVVIPEGCPETDTTTDTSKDTETKTCPTVEDKISSIVTCPTCPETKTCPVVPIDDNAGAVIIGIIALFVGAGIGIYFTRNKVLGVRGGLKVYRGRDGEEKTHHKHSSVRGYHDPYIRHRDEEERHPKGQLLPHYKQNESGKWIYDK